MSPQTSTIGGQENDRAFQAGKKLASPPPGEEVVVSGMAGRFPDSDDIYKYLENIYNKRDLVSSDNRRWDPTNPEIPQRTGKINFIEKFDAGAFGLHYNQVNQMDPLHRITIERAYEAILDAGCNPNDLRGSKTGVFIGMCFSETEKYWIFDKNESPSYGFQGCTRSMCAQNISRLFDLRGPSYILDTACSSSMYALEHAYRAIRDGKCDAALVGGASLCLHPKLSLQFARLGVLSADGVCKAFDAEANGYARSETVSVIYLQKAKDAKRIYAQIVHTKSNCDGYKENGLTYPSGEMQRRLLTELYNECNVDPSIVDFLEAHATGTKVGDPEELTAMDKIFCETRKEPLWIGSIKSNLGHTEPAAGMCSLVKVLLAMENDCLIPNIHYNTPREGIDGLKEGRMAVVTECIPWPHNGSGYAAINSFGFGGANCHVLLKRFTKKKINKGTPKDELPRLICISGRTKEAVEYILDDVNKRILDEENVRILQEVFRKDIPEHPYRGFSIVSKNGELGRSCKWYDGIKQPLCLIFSGASVGLLKAGFQLLKIPLFASAMHKAKDILLPKKVNLMDIINAESDNNMANVIMGSVAVQIASLEVLRTLSVTFDHVLGFSTGLLSAAYADGVLTLSQAILASYYISRCFCDINENVNELDCGKFKAFTSAIGKNFHNTEHLQMTLKLVDHLKDEVLGNKLLQSLNKVIPKPKQRSPKWIFESNGNSKFDLLKLASAEFFFYNLVQPVSGKKQHADMSNSTLVTLGSKSLIVSNFNNIELLADRFETYSVDDFLHNLGRIYELGYNPQIHNLYSKVEWPVSVGTPMVSPLIKWNHDQDWFVALYNSKEKLRYGISNLFISLKDVEWNYFSGHVIDGRNLIPATGYLYMIWDAYAEVHDLLLNETQIVFENVKFHRASTIPKTGSVDLNLMLQKETGKFEIGQPGQPIVTGTIYVPDNFDSEITNLPTPPESNSKIFWSTKDVYKELRLRGYNYSGLFCGIKSIDQEVTKGMIEWKNNWVAFMDNMLQLKLLQVDTRNLYVPVGFERLAINAKGHVNYVQSLNSEDPEIPVYLYKEAGIIKTQFIELRGLFASAIAKRKAILEPLLEAHRFVPNETKISLEQSIRVNFQILLENHQVLKHTIVEVLDEFTNEGSVLLGPIIFDALGEQPLIIVDITVLSKNLMELENITVKDKKLSEEKQTCSVVVLSKALCRPDVIDEAITALQVNGMILSREEVDFDPDTVDINALGLNVISIHQTDTEKLVMLRKATKSVSPMIIEMSTDLTNVNWLSAIQTVVKNDRAALLVSQNQPMSGILGLINCIRREPGGANVKCVFIMDSDSNFDLKNEFYSKQLRKGLAINILKDGVWGTYRHLSLEKETIVQCEHIFNNVLTIGDLSSLRWIQGPFTSTMKMPPEKSLVYVYYCGLNFRDVMSATGRVSLDAFTSNRALQYNVQGLEFAGRSLDGKRVMGMVWSGSFSTLVDSDINLTWEIPDKWTMEEGATIPVVYGTALFSLIVKGELKAGNSVLIHAGSGGVGQAAINICSHYKCQIFTTVGTQEKRDYIRQKFPWIPESHIGNSRDTSFEQMVMKETDGRGVDIVLNSLSEEKLQASVRCLAPGGHFLEIGKFDLFNNTYLDLERLMQGRSFNSVMLDGFFFQPPSDKKKFIDLLNEGIREGYVKPLDRTVYNMDEVEEAFRFMGGGKHIGKVVIKLREEEAQRRIKLKPTLHSGLARFYCDQNSTYIICGGMGGFGLELADWMVLRGAKKLVLISRNGVKNGYQASRIKLWTSYGVDVHIFNDDITNREGCIAMIMKANKIGPVKAIFNLAAVLKDALLENQNEEDFLTVLAPKAIATQHLDFVSREMCPKLQYFVIFSSISCGRGNGGQTNYGMANSIMERICEKRKNDGYPALAIQWGAIGEVGLVAEAQKSYGDMEIGGTVQQRISSCLNAMDMFLAQDEVVVSSIVVAEKTNRAKGAADIMEVVKTVMGVKDLKSVNLYATLPELGMDSMMAVEIKQTLERDYEVFLTAKDIRTLTFAKLKEIADKKMMDNENKENVTQERGKNLKGVQLFTQHLASEENCNISLIRIPSLVEETAVAPKVMIFPGIEGTATALEPLAVNLSSHAICFQYTYSDNPKPDIHSLVESILPNVKENLPENGEYVLLAYSFGCVIALQVLAILESEGLVGKAIFIDGSPGLFKELLSRDIPGELSDNIIETSTLCSLLEHFLPTEIVEKHEVNIFSCKTLHEKIDYVLKVNEGNTPYSELYQRQACLEYCARVKSVHTYQPSFPKLKSSVKLFKPTEPIIDSFDSDYKLQEFFENTVEVVEFNGSHVTIVKNLDMAQAINSIVEETNKTS